MKTLPFIAIVLLCFACGSGTTDMTKIAVTGFPTPLYDGMVSATTGSVTKTLPPHTVVYVQNFELDVNNMKMIKVFVDDSTEGYVPKEWVLEGGKPGVVNCSETNPLIVYEDEEMHVNSGKRMTEVQLVGFRNVTGDVSLIIYADDKDGSRPFTGYIKTPVISDSLSMAFGSLYFDASQKQRFEQNPAPMEALYHDSRFGSAPLREIVFGPVRSASKSAHTTMNFIDEDGNALVGDSIPGVVVLHYIWEDNSESDGNHFGDHLEQGTPDCDPNHSAMGYKLLFTANRRMNVSLVCTLPSVADQEGPRVLNVPNTEAGHTYELLVMPKVYGVVCDEGTVFSVSTTLGYYGEARVQASCGD
jgi:hypothetical protein